MGNTSQGDAGMETSCMLFFGSVPQAYVPRHPCTASRQPFWHLHPAKFASAGHMRDKNIPAASRTGQTRTSGLLLRCATLHLKIKVGAGVGSMLVGRKGELGGSFSTWFKSLHINPMIFVGVGHMSKQLHLWSMDGLPWFPPELQLWTRRVPRCQRLLDTLGLTVLICIMDNILYIYIYMMYMYNMRTV